MDGAAKINEAFEGYSGWSYPWEVMEKVLAFSSLGPTETALIKTVWADANSSDYWQVSELATGCKRAEAGLAKKHPWLTDKARANIARAAAYQWK